MNKNIRIPLSTQEYLNYLVVILKRLKHLLRISRDPNF